MPGLVGTVSRGPDEHIAQRFAQLVAPLRRGERLAEEVLVSAPVGWALGRLHLGTLQPRPQLDDAAPLQVLFHGDLHNGDELATHLARHGVMADPGNAAAIVGALYHLEGPALARRLKGAFCAAVLESSTGTLLLINDMLGSYPLYWSKNPHRLSFASEVKSLLADPDLRPTLDPRAVADYLAFGFLFGQKTLTEQVRLLAPAATLLYDRREGTATVTAYDRIDKAFGGGGDDKPGYLAAVGEAFDRAVQRCLSGPHRFGAALSGGLDSRLILGAARKRASELVTYTLGVRGSADHVIAAKLARIAGTHHLFFDLDTRYLGQFLPNLRQMVHLTDGMYMTHGVTEMLANQYLEQAGIDVLLRGHGGELAKTDLAWPLHTDDAIEAMSSATELVPYLLRRISYIGGESRWGELFSDEWRERVHGGAERSLWESLGELDLSPSDMCSHLYLREHHRRFTVPSLEIFRNTVEVRLPFADVDFLRALLSGRAKWRRRTEIHRAIAASASPALLRVRNSNTGAPGDAGPIREAVGDKLNSLLKLLDVYGFRHYHRFDAWMKTMLLEGVEQVMLDPQTTSRGIFREAGLRRLIAETRQGEARHAYLLQVMLLIELWMRDSLPS